MLLNEPRETSPKAVTAKGVLKPSPDIRTAWLITPPPSIRVEGCGPWRSLPPRPHCGGGGSGVRLGEGAVVTTTVETDLGEPEAVRCWSC